MQFGIVAISRQCLCQGLPQRLDGIGRGIEEPQQIVVEECGAGPRRREDRLEMLATALTPGLTTGPGGPFQTVHGPAKASHELRPPRPTGRASGWGRGWQ